MKKVIIAVLFSLIFICCDKKEDLTKYQYALSSWAAATKEMNYSEYCRYEAYPKSREQFQDMYGEYYLDDMIILSADSIPDKEFVDSQGDRYLKRQIHFDGKLISRKKSGEWGTIKGDADFIKYVSGDKKSERWFIFNRTIVRDIK